MRTRTVDPRDFFSPATWFRSRESLGFTFLKSNRPAHLPTTVCPSATRHKPSSHGIAKIRTILFIGFPLRWIPGLQASVHKFLLPLPSGEQLQKTGLARLKHGLRLASRARGT